jgi:hypothetical protein
MFRFTQRLFSILFLMALVQFSTPANAAGESYNLRLSPLALLIGGISLNFDVAVGPNWTVGPEISYLNFSVSSTTGTSTDNFSIKASGFGGRANWFMNGVFTDGLYVGPAVAFSSAEVTQGTSSASASLLVASALVGYGWFWDSFNMMLGAGIGLPLGDATVKVASGGTQEEVNVRGRLGALAAEWTIGWTF